MEALVKNAANKKQVERAELKEDQLRMQELNDIRFICSHTQGRRLLWRLLSHCKTFESIWENSARIHYNAGKQDVGHFVMSEIVEANPDLYFQMMAEQKKGETTNV